MKKIIALLLMTLALIQNVSAQNSALPAIDPNTKVTVPLAFVIKANENVKELELLRQLNASKDSIIEAKDSQIAKFNEQETKLTEKVASLEVSLDKAEEQLKLSQSNVGLTEQQRALFETRLNEYRVELAETRKDLDSCRSSRKWYMLGGAAGGFLLGKSKSSF